MDGHKIVIVVVIIFK